MTVEITKESKIPGEFYKMEFCGAWRSCCVLRPETVVYVSLAAGRIIPALPDSGSLQWVGQSEPLPAGSQTAVLFDRASMQRRLQSRHQSRLSFYVCPRKTGARCSPGTRRWPPRSRHLGPKAYRRRSSGRNYANRRVRWSIKQALSRCFVAGGH